MMNLMTAWLFIYEVGVLLVVHAKHNMAVDAELQHHIQRESCWQTGVRMRYSPATDMLVIGERFADNRSRNASISKQRSAGNRPWCVIAVGGLDWLIGWLRDLWNVAVAVMIAVVINRILDWFAERSLNCSDCSSGCSSSWLIDRLTEKEQYSSEREQFEWRAKQVQWPYK